MKHVWRCVAMGLLICGCSTLPVSGDGIVALELRVPKTLTVAPGGSIQLKARALNINGDSVAADIRWYTVDTLTISVDSITGLVQPVLTSGVGRVQASVGTLRSDQINITIVTPNP